MKNMRKVPNDLQNKNALKNRTRYLTKFEKKVILLLKCLHDKCKGFLYKIK